MNTDKHGCKPANFRKVVDCGIPLPLFTTERPTQSARGLAQSKTLRVSGDTKESGSFWTAAALRRFC